MYNIMNNSITGMSANQGKIDIISNKQILYLDNHIHIMEII